MKVLNLKSRNALLFIIVTTFMLFVTMQCLTSCNSEKKQPNDKLELNGQTHTFSIGTIRHESGKTIIKLLGDGQSIKFKGSFSGSDLSNMEAMSLTSPVMMSIEVNGQTIPCDNDILRSQSDFEFIFHTEKKPDKIIVYSNDEKKSTIIFDGKTKKIIADLRAQKKELIIAKQNKKTKKWGYVDVKGKTVIPLKYDIVGLFSENLAAVRLDGKSGYINTKGETVIPFKYGFAWAFSDGLARVMLNGKYGFIDTTGKEVIPLKYDYVEIFSGGLVRVQLKDKWFYIDKTGKCVKDCP
jgi:hypothetical protein